MVKNVLRKFFFTGIGLVLIGLSRFAFNELSQLQFGLEQTGRLNLALSLAILLSMPAVASFVPAMLRFVAKARGEGNYDQAHSVMRRLGQFTVGTLIVIAGFMIFFRAEIGQSRGIESQLVYYSAAILLAGGSYQFVRNLCYAMDRVSRYSLFELYAGLGFTVTLFVLIILEAKDHLLLAFIVSHLIFVIVGLREFAGDSSKDASSNIPYRPILAFSFWAFLGTSASWGLRELSIVITADFADLEGVAHMGWCVAFLTPMQFLPRVIRTVIFADTAEKSGRGEDEQAALAVSETSHWIASLNLPVCGVLILLASEILSALTQSSRPEFVLVLRLMIVAIAFDTLSTSASSAISGAGKIKLNMFMSLLGLGAAMTVWFVLGTDSGVQGVAYGLLSASVVRGSGLIIVAKLTFDVSLTRRPVMLCALIFALLLCCFALSFGLKVWLVAGLYALITLGLLFPETKALIMRFRSQNRI